jgi:hypothetical protein
MRNISFRAKDPQEAGKRLEDALNKGEKTVDSARLQELADAVGRLFSAMPEGRQVVCSISMQNGSEPDADNEARVHVNVATVTDRETGAMAQRLGGAEAGDLAVEVSSGDQSHADRQAAAERDERDREARAAQARADELRSANTAATP